MVWVGSPRPCGLGWPAMFICKLRSETSELRLPQHVRIPINKSLPEMQNVFNFFCLRTLENSFLHLPLVGEHGNVAYASDNVTRCIYEFGNVKMEDGSNRLSKPAHTTITNFTLCHFKLTHLYIPCYIICMDWHRFGTKFLKFSTFSHNSQQLLLFYKLAK